MSLGLGLNSRLQNLFSKCAPLSQELFKRMLKSNKYECLSIDMQTVFANWVTRIAFNSQFPTDNKAHGICLSFQEFVSSYFSSPYNYISLVLRLRWQNSALSKWQLHWRTSGEQRPSVSDPLGEWREVRQASYQNVTSWCWKLSSEGSTWVLHSLGRREASGVFWALTPVNDDHLWMGVKCSGDGKGCYRKCQVLLL